MKQTRRQFVRVLFAASQAVVAGRLLAPRLFAEAAPAPSGGLNFIIFGDWGRRGETDQTEVAAQMAGAAKGIGARFIISVGDNFYEDGVASTEDEHWRKSFGDVYAADSLQVPWHVILGNHDYHGNCDAQLAYAKINPRWKMPARYYARTEQIDAATAVEFFFIDTTPMLKYYYNPNCPEKTRAKVLTQDVPGQLAWLKNALASSKAQWKIVIGHHPIYSSGEHGDSQELIDNVLPLLHEHKIPVYFNGHDHDLQHLMAGEVNLFCSGAGSQVRPTGRTEHTKFSVASSGFTTVALQADKLDVQMIDNHGKLLYATSVARPA